MSHSDKLNLDIPTRKEPFLCRCLNDCPDGLDNSTCELSYHAKCYKKMYINEFGEEEIRAGCLASQTEQIDQCNKLANPDFEARTDLKCCSNYSLCNDRLVMQLPPISEDDYENDEMSKDLNTEIMIIIVAAACLLILSTATILICRFWFRKREKTRQKEVEEENRQAFYPFYDDTGCALDRMSLLTSSGAGVPLLAQRTIARQTETVKEIGRGRYGTVKLGKWRDEFVAMKIFFSKDEDSWFRETEIYQTVMLRHENILGFIAADVISSSDACTQLFLITEYHENGSLYDYLNSRVLDVVQAIKLAYTACCGLAHLHTEITGTQGKPGIAHRDIKSKNILVKRDGQCCVADMGLAVQYSRSDGKVNIGKYEKSQRQGTRRYMSPEVILQSFHPDNFTAYKASDIYSFSLVMWEILNRTSIKGIVRDYHPPYYNVVGSDPDLDEMKKVVVVENMRPEVFPEWDAHQVLGNFVTTMQESWVSRYESRLTMLRIRKTLSALHGINQAAMDVSQTSSDSDRKPSASSISLSTASNSPVEDSRTVIAEELRQSTFVI